jgi:hypothetical protein
MDTASARLSSVDSEKNLRVANRTAPGELGAVPDVKRIEVFDDGLTNPNIRPPTRIVAIPEKVMFRLNTSKHANCFKACSFRGTQRRD